MAASEVERCLRDARHLLLERDLLGPFSDEEKRRLCYSMLADMVPTLVRLLAEAQRARAADAAVVEAPARWSDAEELARRRWASGATYGATLRALEAEHEARGRLVEAVAARRTATAGAARQEDTDGAGAGDDPAGR